MITFWLIITTCLAVCEPRHVPVPFVAQAEELALGACQHYAAGMIRTNPGTYRMPFLCTRSKPTGRPIPASIAPGRWA